MMSKVYIMRVTDGLNDDYVRAFTSLKKAVFAFVEEYEEYTTLHIDKEVTKQLYLLAKKRQDNGEDMLLVPEDLSGLWDDFFNSIEVVELE